MREKRSLRRPAMTTREPSSNIYQRKMTEEEERILRSAEEIIRQRIAETGRIGLVFSSFCRSSGTACILSKSSSTVTASINRSVSALSPVHISRSSRNLIALRARSIRLGRSCESSSRTADSYNLCQRGLEEGTLGLLMRASHRHEKFCQI